MQTTTSNDSLTLAGAVDAALQNFAFGERFWGAGDSILVLRGLRVSPCSDLAMPAWAEVSP